MKVLRLIARLNVGGPAKHVVWLSEGLQRHGYETLLAYGKVEGDEDSLEGLLDGRSFQSKVIPSLSRSINPLRDLVTIAQVFSLILKYQPQIVHTHTSKAGFCGRIAAILAIPFLRQRLFIFHTFHGHTFHGYFSSGMHRIFLVMERFLARYCSDRIITISAQQQVEIRDHYGVGRQEQHLLIPLGLDFSFVQNRCGLRLRTLFQIPANAFVYGIVGRIAPIKNHSLFLRSVYEYLQRTGDKFSTFVIIGSGDSGQLENLKAEAQHLEILNRVVFTGNQTDPAEIYGLINCLVLTSRNEGTPLSILEAFAARVPVIATAVGGVRDLLGENERGVLVDETAESIATAMQLIRGQDNEVRDRAEQFVINGYGVERLIEQVHQAYSSCLKPN